MQQVCQVSEDPLKKIKATTCSNKLQKEAEACKYHSHLHLSIWGFTGETRHLKLNMLDLYLVSKQHAVYFFNILII